MGFGEAARQPVLCRYIIPHTDLAGMKRGKNPGGYIVPSAGSLAAGYSDQNRPENSNAAGLIALSIGIGACSVQRVGRMPDRGRHA